MNGDEYVNDARVAAWVAAWDQLQVASNIAREHPDDERANIWIDRAHRNAEIMASLASVPDEVGGGADMVIQERDQKKKRDKAALKDFMRDKDATHRTAPE